MAKNEKHLLYIQLPIESIPLETPPAKGVKISKLVPHPCIKNSPPTKIAGVSPDGEVILVPPDKDIKGGATTLCVWKDNIPLEEGKNGTSSHP